MESSNYFFIDIVISAVLALIMYGLGLTLTLRNFKDIILFPKSFLVGLSIQMLALPIIAFIIVSISGISTPYKVGLIILAACPGGTTSGFITYLFKGNVALSVSLTSVNSILTIFSIPIIVNLTLHYYYGYNTTIHLSVLQTILQIATIAVIPVFLGIYTRYKNATMAIFIEKYLKIAVIVLLALVFSIKFFANKSNGGTEITFAQIVEILPYALFVNIGSLLFAYFMGILLKTGKVNSFTIAIEAAVHNTTLALLITATLLQNNEMSKPALIYAMFSFWTALIFGYFYLKRTK